MRASDADREAYVEVLQRAYLDGRLSKDEYDERMGAAYSARTYAELAPLLADLPVSPGQVPGPPVTEQPTPRAAPLAGVGTNTTILALFSEVTQDSRWTVRDGQVATAAFGSVTLDLRAATLESAVTEVRANAIFGSVEITVPGDIAVQVDGFGVFGEYQRIDNRTVRDEAPGQPLIRISGLALFGSVEVKIVDPPVTGKDRITGPPPGPGIES